MTGTERRGLHVLIDRRRRQLVADLDEPRCAECGCDMEARTSGCRACTDRVRKRVRRRAGEIPWK